MTHIFVKFLIFCMTIFYGTAAMAQAKMVNFENYAEAETSLTIQRLLKGTGGVNSWLHFREPTPLDKQSIIRMNRDTLYSIAIVDVSKGAHIFVPKADNRYISMAVINEYGYTNMVALGGGDYALDSETVGSTYAIIIMRIFVDANNAEDVKKVNMLQDQYSIKAKNNQAFPPITWDKASYQKVYDPLLELFKIAHNAKTMFGTKESVDPLYFLVGTAGGFGGLPSKNAMYFNFAPAQKNAKSFEAHFKDMPVKGFWSVTVYNKDGYLFASEHGASSLNNATAKRSSDGTYTLYFGNCSQHKENCLAIQDGWNGILRMYEPDESVINGTWERPRLTPVQ